MGDDGAEGAILDEAEVVRRVNALWPTVRPAIDADHAFFARHPDRGFRVRRATAAEAAVLALLLDGAEKLPPDDSMLYATVRNCAPGVVDRSFHLARDEAVDDFSDEKAERSFFTPSAIGDDADGAIERMRWGRDWLREEAEWR